MNQIWKFEYTDRSGKLVTGTVTVKQGEKPDSKIAAVYGQVMHPQHWGVKNLRLS